MSCLTAAPSILEQLDDSFHVLQHIFKKGTESLNSMYLVLECLRAFVNVKRLVAQNAEH
jgi:hypothetical protein